ncbi:MAG: hypothetical protein R3230_00905 [Nitrosopumilaceae archaeon]|nr:hypothetical protein [Nitrosopumilaceae archaeon]
MTTATLLYSYKADDAKLYIHYPHITKSIDVESGIDGEYVVFEDQYDMYEFMDYLEENNLDISGLHPVSFGDWEVKALALSELI